MHAPDVVLHYVVCKHRAVAGDNSHLKEMVDLTAYLLKHFDGARLWKFMYEDSGDDSVAFLKELGGLSRREVLELPATAVADGADVARNLLTHGPALIARFSTFAAFKTSDPPLHSFIGEDESAHGGNHAMAIVGYRDEGGDVRFLVQNWWSSKQFFECDLAFLQSRHATLAWVIASRTALPNCPPTLNEEFGEGDGGGEDRCEEDRS
jgi:hypothetical protein